MHWTTARRRSWVSAWKDHRHSSRRRRKTTDLCNKWPAVVHLCETIPISLMRIARNHRKNVLFPRQHETWGRHRATLWSIDQQLASWSRSIFDWPGRRSDWQLISGRCYRLGTVGVHHNVWRAGLVCGRFVTWPNQLRSLLQKVDETGSCPL